MPCRAWTTLPLVLEDVEADAPVLVDVWMVYARRELPEATPRSTDITSQQSAKTEDESGFEVLLTCSFGGRNG